MADKNTRQLTPDELQEDLDDFAGLEAIPDYEPSNDEFKLNNGIAIKTSMQAKETQEIQSELKWQADRDDKVIEQWAFHDFMRNARVQVKAQFGENSNQVASVGLKKKSEYKSPTHKPAKQD
jgi:hypothetical protein